MDSIDLDLLKTIILTRNIELNLIFIVTTKSVEYANFLVPISFLIYGFIVKKVEFKQNVIIIVCSVLFSAILVTILKQIFNKERPFVSHHLIHNLVSAGSPSFPSGHTADAFVLATAICLAFPNRFLIIVLFIWAILVGYSRMYLGVHYPSDVLAGAILGSLSAFFARKIIKNSKFSIKRTL